MPRTFVLSAHGGDRKSQLTALPIGIRIYFYVEDNMIFDSENRFQSQVCSGESDPLRSIESTPFKTQYFPSSMYFTPDSYRTFYSGIVECPIKKIVYSIDHSGPITLGSVIENLIQYVGAGNPFDLHILTCTVDTRLGAASPGYSNVGNRTIEGTFTDSFRSMHFGGDYKQKYLKYKKKYLELKKLHQH
jgi:hypothetical protein